MSEHDNITSIWYTCQENEDMKGIIYAWSKDEKTVNDYIDYHHTVLHFDHADFCVMERKYHNDQKLKDFEKKQNLFQLVQLHGHQSPVVTVAEKKLLIPHLKKVYTSIQQQLMSIINETVDTAPDTEGFSKFAKEHFGTFDCFLDRMGLDMFSKNFSMHPIVASIIYANQLKNI